MTESVAQMRRYAQHVWWGDNTIQNVWGNDREVMTYDNRGNQYFGPVADLSSDGKNITTFGRGAGFGNGNGWVLDLELLSIV